MGPIWRWKGSNHMRNRERENRECVTKTETGQVDMLLVHMETNTHLLQLAAAGGGHQSIRNGKEDTDRAEAQQAMKGEGEARRHDRIKPPAHKHIHGRSMQRQAFIHEVGDGGRGRRRHWWIRGG